METPEKLPLFTNKTTKKELQKLVNQLQSDNTALHGKITQLEVGQVNAQFTEAGSASHKEFLEEEHIPESQHEEEDSMQVLGASDFSSSRIAFQLEFLYRGENVFNGKIIHLLSKQQQKFKGIKMEVVEAFIRSKLPQLAAQAIEEGDAEENVIDTIEQMESEFITRNLDTQVQHQAFIPEGLDLDKEKIIENKEEKKLTSQYEVPSDSQKDPMVYSVEVDKEGRVDILNDKGNQVVKQLEEGPIAEEEMVEISFHSFELITKEGRIIDNVVMENRPIFIHMHFQPPNFEGTCECYIIAESLINRRSHMLVNGKAVHIHSGAAVISIEYPNLTPGTYKLNVAVLSKGMNTSSTMQQKSRMLKFSPLVSA